MYFKKKIIVVTGSANGIGKAIVKRFLNEGAIVISSDINFSDKKIDNNHYQKQCDVSSEEEINKLIDWILENFQTINFFCSNAGILSLGDEQTSNLDWKKNWDVHLMSHVYFCRRIIPQFKKQTSGHIIITSSAAGLLTHIDSLTYSVTKQASIAFAEWIAIANKEFGINVSVLCPQAVKTNMTKGSWKNRRQEIEDRTIFGRWGESEDLVGTVVFLLSSASEYITGQDIYVDGGYLTKGMMCK